MITYIIMGLLLLFLAMSVIWNAKKCVDSNHFFDIENTKAMRGFWCLVIILVHVPAAYQNRIQDMIGSFAYIGVILSILLYTFSSRNFYAVCPSNS